MKIAILGAGPAGLYAAILLRRTRPDLEIEVIEQNAPDATFGFGVVFSDQALGFLRAGDPETADLIEPHMQSWSDIVINHKGERIVIDGVGFAAIGRLELLKLLQARAADMGIVPRYNTRVATLADLPATDLVIGADGLNSMLRTAEQEAYGERIDHLGNRFVWYGADREFDALTQTFIDTEYGPMNAHHYSYAPGRATFIIEMRPDTFERTGFAQMEEAAYRSKCTALFAEYLEGASLIPNGSNWRQFPNLSCDTWHSGNRVLVGDALHTAHFSIGSGTRLALEDVMALVCALRDQDWNVRHALPAYQSARQPVLEKITKAARRSAAWYEEFDAHMAMAPWPFALSYIRRAGRLDAERLQRLAPVFTDELRRRDIDLEVA